jgi:hypothetical protein
MESDKSLNLKREAITAKKNTEQNKVKNAIRDRIPSLLNNWLMDFKVASVEKLTSPSNKP